MKTVEEIRNDMFRKKLARDSHRDWIWYEIFTGLYRGKPSRRLIEEQLAAGNLVKGGYTCTQIRGYHERWILVKEPTPKTNRAKKHQKPDHHLDTIRRPVPDQPVG